MKFKKNEVSNKVKVNCLIILRIFVFLFLSKNRQNKNLQILKKSQYFMVRGGSIGFISTIGLN